MMFGCEDNKRMNKVLRKDNTEYSQYFGLPGWADQSVISDTFGAMTADNINQLESVWKESLEVTQTIGNLRRRIVIRTDAAGGSPRIIRTNRGKSKRWFIARSH